MAEYCDIAEESALLSSALVTGIATVFLDVAVLDDLVLHGIATMQTEAALLNDASTESEAVITVETAVLHSRLIDTGQTWLNIETETAAIGDGITSTLITTLSEAAVLNDGIRTTWAATLLEVAQLGDQIVGGQTVRNVTTEAGQLGDAIYSSPGVVTLEQAVLNDGISSFIERANLTTEAAVIHGNVVGGALLVNTVTEAAVLNDSAFSTVIARNVTTETAELGDGLIEAHAGNAWAASTDTFAMSRYASFPLGALAAINGEWVAGNDDGLYTLSGNTDAGAQIDAELVGDLNDLLDGGKGPSSQENLRRPQYLHLGYSTDGVLRFNVSETESGDELKYSYDLPARVAVKAVTNRVKLGKGLRSRYWRFGIENVDGANFGINDGSITFAVLQRRA
jgi:hypothetical protein